jgi:hypothetical protein
VRRCRNGAAAYYLGGNEKRIFERRSLNSACKTGSFRFQCHNPAYRVRKPRFGLSDSFGQSGKVRIAFLQS